MPLNGPQRAHTGVRGVKRSDIPLPRPGARAKRRAATVVERAFAEERRKDRQRDAELRKSLGAHGRLMRMLAEHGAGDGMQDEYAFAESIGRNWLFDIAYPAQRLAVEIEGGIFAKGSAKPCPVCKQRKRGAHGSVTGILRDIEKYNAAVLLGWRVLRVPTHQITWESVRMICAALGVKRAARRVQGVRRAATS
jgi:hypothetical protein